MKTLIRALADWSGVTDEIEQETEKRVKANAVTRIAQLSDEFRVVLGHQQTNEVAEITLAALADWLHKSKNDGQSLWQVVQRTALAKRHEFHDKRTKKDEPTDH